MANLLIAPYGILVAATFLFTVAARLRPPPSFAWLVTIALMGTTWIAFDLQYAMMLAIFPRSELDIWRIYHASRAVSVVIVGLAAAKLLAVATWPKRVHLRGVRFALYMLWPDVTPEPFARPRSPATWAEVRKDIALGVRWMLVGAAAWASLLLVDEGSAASWALTLVGASLIVHFGVLRIGRGLLRALGFSVPALFSSPLTSTSLREFWGRRWNRAFSNLMRVVVARPIAAAGGGSRAVFVSFVASALLHEMALTWPVWSGIGGPTAYFVIQGLAHAYEARFRPKGLGRGWVLVVVALPVPLVFPPEWTSLLESGIRFALERLIHG